MANLVDRFFATFRGTRDAAKPTKAQGVPGFQAWGGYIQHQETNSELVGARRWQKASDILTNVSVVAASLRFILNLVSRPSWNFEPADDSDEAQKYAEFMEDLVYQLDVSWTRVVRRLAMYRYYGFGLHEWVAKKGDDGKVTFESLDVRPCHTIERWDLDDHGKVRGVWQRDPMNGQEVYLPRKKLLYLVDDSMTDLPDGMGWFRHLVDPANALRSLLELEKTGFERDLRGTPVGRAPMRELNNMVKAGELTQAQADQMVSDLRSFAALERRTSNTGLVFDSAVYESNSDSGTSPSATYLWGMELLTGEPVSLEELGNAVNRLATDMALIMGTDVILTGREGEGSRALSEDKSRNLYLNVNSMLADIAEAIDRDLTPIIWEMNGFPEDMMPTASPEDVAFREVKEITAALADMVDAGYMLAPDDPAFDHLRDLLGLPAGEPIDPEMLQAMQGMQQQGQQPQDGANDNGEDADGGGGGNGGQQPAQLMWRDEQEDDDEAAAKAAPRPLYVRRDLLNAQDLIDWAKANGFETTMPAEQMHVTQLYSKRPVDPMIFPAAPYSVYVPEGGPRTLERFGDAVVLRFACKELDERHREMMRHGASHDHHAYQPHVTISWNAPNMRDTIAPFQGELRFGPEIFEPINEDWREGIIEKFDPNQPREPAGRSTGGRWTDGTSGISFEIAPNPDNKALTERWDKLSDEEKQAISDQLSGQFTPQIMDALGIEDYEVIETMGGFEGHMNPSYLVTVGDRPFDVAGAIGDAYAQKAMVVWGGAEGEGLAAVGVADVFIDNASPDALRDIESRLGDIGAAGWTYSDGRMRFLNFSGDSDEAFAGVIDERLGGDYMVGHGTAYSAYIEENDYARPKTDAAGADWGQFRGAIRSEFASALEGALGEVGKVLAQAFRKAFRMKRGKRGA